MNSDNLGVGALTVAHMVILREIAAGLGLDPQFRILGWHDPKPPISPAMTSRSCNYG